MVAAAGRCRPPRPPVRCPDAAAAGPVSAARITARADRSVETVAELVGHVQVAVIGDVTVVITQHLLQYCNTRADREPVKPVLNIMRRSLQLRSASQ